MTELDLFRRARPEVGHLDDDTAEDLRRMVFGDDASPYLAGPARWRRAVLVAAAMALAAGAALAAVHRGTRSIQPAAPAPAAADSSDATTTVMASTTAAEDATPLPDRGWRDGFDPSYDFNVLMEQAFDAGMRRCIADAGFEFRGKPFDTDSALGEAAPSIEMGTYEAAWYGIGGQGGCQDSVYSSLFGAVMGPAYGSDLHSTLPWGEMTRTVLDAPDMDARLRAFAVCAHDHGVFVHDIGANSRKAYDDIVGGMGALAHQAPGVPDVNAVNPDGTMKYSPREIGALLRDAVEVMCPGLPAFEDDVNAALDVAELAWIDAHPAEMAGLDAELAEDVSRFRYVIDHHGELPPW